MIVKKIKNPKKSSSKASRATGLTNYIREPQNENSVEKCIYSEGVNFFSNTEFGQTCEMIALASETNSKDPIDHWVLSWKHDERPTVEQAREAVQIFISHCGLEGHQYVWGLHDDTDNLHVHIALNRVSPDASQVVKINKGFDLNAGHQAIALIEDKQGWSKEKDARYDIENGKPVLRKNDKDKKRKPDSRAASMEIQTGEKSEQRIAIEQAAPIIQQARSWRELHAAIAAAGMEYRREGSGAKVYIDGNATGVKASDVDRKASFSALQKRLGPYQPPTEINKNDYHDTSRNFDKTKVENALAIGKNTGHGLRNLSKCTLAHSEKRGKNHGSRVLQLDARADRRAAGGLRRSAGSRPGRAGLKEGQSGWQEYQLIQAELKIKKSAASAVLAKKQAEARTALFARQRAERAELFSRSWKGKGDERNAMQSVVAVRHAAEKLELQERQRAARVALNQQYKLAQTYKNWREQPQIIEPISTSTQRPANAPVPAALPPQLSTILRDLTQTVRWNAITYKSKNVEIFRDEGKLLSVRDQSSSSIAVALAVAQQKFGSTLTLTGPAEFQRKAVEAVVANNLGIKFSDPQLEALRLQLIAERREVRQAPQPPAPSVKSAPKAREQAQRADALPSTPAPADIPAPAEPAQAIDELEEEEMERAIAAFCAGGKHEGKPIVDCETKRISGVVVARTASLFAVAGHKEITVHMLTDASLKTNGSAPASESLQPGQIVHLQYKAGGSLAIDIKEQRREHQTGLNFSNR